MPFNIDGTPARQPTVKLRGRKTLWNGRFSDYGLHTVWLSARENPYKNAVYSDRMLFDWGRYERLARVHFGDVSHYWNNRTPVQIEAFLADYFMLPEGSVQLCKVTKERNRSNGQHLWAFFYTYTLPEDFCLVAPR
jgi:hypothetical protein